MERQVTPSDIPAQPNFGPRTVAHSNAQQSTVVLHRHPIPGHRVVAHFLCKRAGLPSLLNNSTCRSSCCCCCYCCCCCCCCQTGNGNQIWTISTLCCAVILPSSWPPFLSLLTNQMRAKRSKYRGDVIVHFLSVLKDDADLATRKLFFSIFYLLCSPPPYSDPVTVSTPDERGCKKRFTDQVQAC